MIGLPIFMTHFPGEMNVFYMKRVVEDRTQKESLDLVMRASGRSSVCR